MSENRFSFPACMIAGKGRIEAYDVLMLRTYAFPEGVRRVSDTQMMLELHDLCPTQCDEWANYFVESLSAYLVNGGGMPGVIDERKTSWLIRAIADNGAVRSWLEIELLLHVMEIADSTTETLSAFALDQVRIGLSTTASGRLGGISNSAYGKTRPAQNGVTAFDLSYIWRVLRPAVDKGRLMLSMMELAILSEIDALAQRSDHHPGWNEIMLQFAAIERLTEASKQLYPASHWLPAEADLQPEGHAA
ncbi:hypothetical protein [Neorhizobium alkalisoli]|uniref:Uncharacterized protein n=1 Tax=Neorhizobium alkalisoli TaxID=528178 RepID=A0A561QUY2_9HYPH|nr:hypothetical protein [Neorhizobium alkalisoli]TWF54188.1 hypothetical protein FHW37_10349 [Neorhizobium alkalisoli]